MTRRRRRRLLTAAAESRTAGVGQNAVVMQLGDVAAPQRGDSAMTPRRRNGAANTVAESSSAPPSRSPPSAFSLTTRQGAAERWKAVSRDGPGVGLRRAVRRAPFPMGANRSDSELLPIKVNRIEAQWLQHIVGVSVDKFAAYVGEPRCPRREQDRCVGHGVSHQGGS